MDFLETHFAPHPFDVLGLLDTHHSDESDFPQLLIELGLSHHLVHTPMPASDTSCGIVVVLSKLFHILDVDIPLPGRILTVTAQHSITQVEYLFTFYYGLIPHRHTSAELKAAMLSLGRPHTSHSNSFIIGDFNFVETTADRPTGLNSGDTKILPFWKAIPVIFRDAFRVFPPLKRFFPFK